MSTTGGGEIILLPATAVGFVAGAALVAAAGVVIAGGVIAYQVGRGVVACGRKVSEAIQEHAARQRAINAACAQYEARVLRAARGGTAIPATAGAERRMQLLARMNARRELARQPAPEPPLPPLLPDPGLQPDPMPSVRLAHHATLDLDADQVAAELERIATMLTELEDPRWLGLVTVGDLRDRLAELKHEVERNRGATAGESIRLLYDLQQEVHALRAEIAYRAAESRAKHEQRQRAAESLAQAAEHLHVKAQALSAEPGMESALAVAYDLLTEADQLLIQGEPVAAHYLAETALSYVDELSLSLDALRRSNAEVAITALRDYVSGFKFPPEDPTPIALNRLIAEAEAQLQAGEFEACWMTLKTAQAEADQVAAQVEQKLQTAQRDVAIKMAQETFKEMGYTTGPVSIRPDGDAEFTAKRDDGAHFRVWVTPDGLLQYKAENFGTAECQTETARFFERVKEKGMIINVQSEFNLAAALARLREVMLRQGYTMVREEVASDGKGRVLTGTMASGESVRYRVNYEGAAQREESPLPSAEHVPQQPTQFVPPDAEQARRLAEQARRQHLQMLREQMRSRRLRN